MTELKRKTDDTDRIYDLIELERKERRTDIAEIHKRVDQILDAVNNIASNKNGNGANWRQTVTIIVAILAVSIPTMTAIVKPIQQQINYLSEDLNATEKRTEKTSNAIDAKIQAEIATLDKAVQLENERTKARISKLERSARINSETHLPRLSVLEERTDRIAIDVKKICNDSP